MPAAPAPKESAMPDYPPQPPYRPDFGLPVTADVYNQGHERLVLGYETASPYEMTIAFPDRSGLYGTPEGVVWNMSFEHLCEHLRSGWTVGAGDIKILSAGTGAVAVALSNDAGKAVVVFNRGDLELFVRQARTLVPAGDERQGNIDAAIGALLGRPAHKRERDR